MAVREYSQLRRLQGTAIEGRSLEAAEECINEVAPEAEEATAHLDQELFRLSKDQGSAAALLCLRCRVSYPIEAWAKTMRKQWHSRGVELASLACYGLDDLGRLRLKTVAGDFLPFTYEQISALPKEVMSPFTAEVIRTYDPQRSTGLPHWSKQKIQAHNGIKSYLKDLGILLISDEALLRHTSLRKTRDAVEFFGVSSASLEQCLELKRRYDRLYDDAKKAYKERTGKSAGWIPEESFLEQLSPERDGPSTRALLKGIAEALRKLETGRLEVSLVSEEGAERDVAAAEASLDGAPAQGPSPAEQLELIGSALQRAMDSVMPLELEGEAKRFKRDPDKRHAWELYGKGFSTRQISDACGKGQAWVSKALKEKERAQVVATAAAVELKRHDAFRSCGQSPEAVERLVEGLRNHLITPKQEGDIAPLRQWIHQHFSHS